MKFALLLIEIVSSVHTLQVSYLVKTDGWKAGKLDEAITQAYLNFDESLDQKDQWEELHKLAGNDKSKYAALTLVSFSLPPQNV